LDKTFDNLLIADALSMCKEPLVPTDSHTKALAIFPDGNKLLECTSLYQGRCRTRNLSNIRREADVRFSRPGLVPNDGQSSTQIFVGSGPSAGFGGASFPPAGDSLSQPAQPKVCVGKISVDLRMDCNILCKTFPLIQVLYVGSTYVPVSQGPRDALDVPAVSSLSLEPGRLFEFTAQSISSGTFMKLDYRRMPFFRSAVNIIWIRLNKLPTPGLIMLAALRPTALPTLPPDSQSTRHNRTCSQPSPRCAKHEKSIFIYI
jgi:hypothetical protein